MNTSSLLNKIKSCRLISIDPSSTSLAWSVLDIKSNCVDVVGYGKIDYSKFPEMSNKFDIIKKELPSVCKKYKPSIGVIEQSVFIQNFQASRLLSYIIGFSWGVLDDYCDKVMDVNPLMWKSGIGYKNVRKKDVDAIMYEHGEKGIQKRLVKERKDRVKSILMVELPGVDWMEMDSDITDAVGIGLWYGLTNG